MLLSMLNYLSDPLFFAGFSVVVGVAYVVVWVVSLHELGRSYKSTSFHLSGMRDDSDQAAGVRGRRMRYPKKSVNVRVDNRAGTNGNRRARITRAA